MIFYGSYLVRTLRPAQKSLDALSEPQHSKIVQKMKDLVSLDKKPLDIKKLQGYCDLYRLVVDDYRVVFIPIHDEKSLLVVFIGHRRDVYNRLSRMNF